MRKIYAAYECDGWKSIGSMDVRSPVVMTTSRKKLVRAVSKEFKIPQWELSNLNVSKMNQICEGWFITSFNC